MHLHRRDRSSVLMMIGESWRLTEDGSVVDRVLAVEAREGQST